MRLYTLANPTEHKFGGTLTPSEEERCQTRITLESPRWAPYPWRSCRVENVCGRFLLDGAGANWGAPVLDDRLSPVSFRVSSPFGLQTELYHLSGHVTSRATPGLPKSMIFKGVRGAAGLASLRKDMLLEGEPVVSSVHMAVVGCCLGARLETSQGCYLENRVAEGAGGLRGGWLAVGSRSLDQCNVVRLGVREWAQLSLLPGALAPLSNDIVVTGKGSLVHRLTWEGLAWDEGTEAAVLEACERVAGEIRAVLV